MAKSKEEKAAYMCEFRKTHTPKKRIRPESHKEYLSQWRKDNRDKMKGYVDKWIESNPEKAVEQAKARSRKSYLKNRSHTTGLVQTYDQWRIKSYEGMQSRVSRMPTYLVKGIKLLMTKEEFNIWCDSHKNLIEQLLKLKASDRRLGPTIDRIDSNGHYEPGNIQILTWSDNAAKNQPQI